MAYRYVKSNTGSDLINLGVDEGQGGQDWNGLGSWTTYTVASPLNAGSPLLPRAEEIGYLDVDDPTGSSLMIEDSGTGLPRLLTVEEVEARMGL